MLRKNTTSRSHVVFLFHKVMATVVYTRWRAQCFKKTRIVNPGRAKNCKVPEECSKSIQIFRENGRKPGYTGTLFWEGASVKSEPPLPTCWQAESAGQHWQPGSPSRRVLLLLKSNGRRPHGASVWPGCSANRLGPKSVAQCMDSHRL